AWVRAYASAVGLDPIDTVNEFCRLFPQGDRRVEATMAGIAAIIAAESAYRDDISHADRRRAGAAPPRPAAAPPRTVRAHIRTATEAVTEATRQVLSRVVGLRPSRDALR